MSPRVKSASVERDIMNSLKSARLLSAWQLSVLRFAITLDDPDRLNIAAVAAEVDLTRWVRRRSLAASPPSHQFRALRRNPRPAKRFGNHPDALPRRGRYATAEARLSASDRQKPIKRRARLDVGLFRG
jgi:hypothetical protein